MFEQAIEKNVKKMIYFAERYGMTSQKQWIVAKNWTGS